MQFNANDTGGMENAWAMVDSMIPALKDGRVAPTKQTMTEHRDVQLMRGTGAEDVACLVWMRPSFCHLGSDYV